MLNIPWPPPFPPLPPLPLLAAALLVIGLSLWIVARFVLIRLDLRIPALGPGRVAVLTGDGGLHIAGFLASAAGAPPSNTLTWSKTLRPGDIEESDNRSSWDLKGLSLSADQKLLAELSTQPVGRIENDYVVELWDVDRSVSLFQASDNFVPRAVFRGNDPNAPPVVSALQAEKTDIWRREELPIDPSRPEPILTFKLDGGSQGNRLEIAGWTTDGHLAVTGVAFWEIVETGSIYDTDDSDEQPWWGIVDPAAPRSSEYYPTGIGPLPASYSLAPEPRPLRVLTLTYVGYDRSAGTLFVDGVEQTAAWLASRVKGFSGPFRA